MPSFGAVTLLINGLTLALALGFLLIVLWYDARKTLNQFFAALLVLVMVWNTGDLLGQIDLLIEGAPWTDFALALREIGFTGSSVAMYIFTTALIGVHSRRFRILALLSLMVVTAYNVFLIVNKQALTLASESPQAVSAVFYILFDGVTFFVLWRYRRKVESVGLLIGIGLFLIGQSLGFLNPEFGANSVSTTISAIGTLIASFALLQREIIRPLTERLSQVEAMHHVSVSISSQLAIDEVLDSIASQAVKWLGADASGIFLLEQEKLRLASLQDLPPQFIATELRLGQGVAGAVAQSRESILLENYGRDWKAEPDLPFAKQTFGAVVCVPLIYARQVIGVLMVISSPQGRLFDRDDVHLLELLAAQAAVAIAHGGLFDEQRALTSQLEAAHSQLQTVLVSTENPVIAVDRKLRLIFANPAAEKLFSIPAQATGTLIYDLLPRSSLPVNARDALRDLRKNRVHIYEITLDDRVYLCHLAGLGESYIQGWVAVLNDVTQLKELDRIKSEMVRMTSHDLKNPLQAAMANLELLREDVVDLENAEVVVSVNAIEKQLEKMNRIIRTILDLERVKTGTLSVEYCNPARIVDSAVGEVRDWAREMKINLSVQVAEDVAEFRGDFEQFERALINLLENAIKFTPAGGEVVISAYSKGEEVIFEVKDNGIGIPEELHGKIFDRFFRGRQKEVEHVSGSGLGLSLVKAVVENHRGKVWVESQAGRGTIFFIAVPSAAERELSN